MHLNVWAITTFLFLIGSAFSNSSISTAKENDASNLRIIGGIDAPVGQYPFMASILTARSACAGTLIAPSYVLTAAHCVNLYSTSADEIWYSDVYLNTLNVAGGEPGSITRFVNKIIVHKNFSNIGTGYVNDIAIIVLTSPATTITPVQIAEETTTTAPSVTQETTQDSTTTKGPATEQPTSATTEELTTTEEPTTAELTTEELTTEELTTESTTLEPTTETTTKPTTTTKTTTKPTTKTTTKPTTKTTTKPTTKTTTKPTTKTTTKPTTKTTTKPTTKTTTKPTTKTTTKPTTKTTKKPTTKTTTKPTTKTTKKPTTKTTKKPTKKRALRNLNNDESPNAVIAGWGLTSDGGYGSNTLKAADVQILSNQVCAQKWGSLFDANSMMCAAGSTSSICVDDEGGPILVNGSQVGIASFFSRSNQCNDPDAPAVFTRISAYAAWIAQTMAENPPPEFG